MDHLHTQTYPRLRSLTSQSFLDEIKAIFSQFWLSTDELESLIQAKLVEYEANDSELKVTVSGETKGLTAYLIHPREGVLVVSPSLAICHNVLLQELYNETDLPTDRFWHIFPPSPPLLQRLTLPKVLLVNPCVLENFPIPRLSLSIGLLASYLRKYHKANVNIIDMQVGVTIEEVVARVIELKPDLFGMSISYGQKYVGLSILDGIYVAKQKNLINPLVVLGNIIPANYPQEFIELYPDLIVACGEGEVTIVGLIDYLNGKQQLASIPGIAYLSQNGGPKQIKRTLNGSVPVHTIPLPALDTIPDLSKWKGALTLELSRGCQWNVCTFCPREHKSSIWKTYNPNQIIEQFSYLNTLCEKLNLRKHVFLADEEFVGGMNDGLETERIISMARGLIDRQFGIRFDAAARVDQVYTQRMDKKWHIRRVEMWHLCRQAGLDRLFMGLESGAIPQLQRYGKGIKPDHSIYAIRILSSLGIPLRFGFITFDQLMIGLNDLKDNIRFLERRDAFMKPIDVSQYGYAKLFDLLVNDKDFVAEHAMQKPLYSGVSYMLASLEVLINSRYQVSLRNAEKRHGKQLIVDGELPDTNMGRVKVKFVDTLIRDLSVSSQKWIDRHFGMAYTVKSLYKTASRVERKHLMSWMVNYREICLLLLKAFVYIFDEENNNEEMVSTLPDQALITNVKGLRQYASTEGAPARLKTIEACMDFFDQKVEEENNIIESLLKSRQITDTIDGQLDKVIVNWKAKTGKWELINDVERLETERKAAAPHAVTEAECGNY